MSRSRRSAPLTPKQKKLKQHIQLTLNLAMFGTMIILTNTCLSFYPPLNKIGSFIFCAEIYGFITFLILKKHFKRKKPK